MQRLYKFFFLLFIILLIISGILNTFVLYGVYHIIMPDTIEIPIPNVNPVHYKPLRLLAFLKPGFFYGIINTVALLLIIVLLIKKSFQTGNKFTFKKNLFTAGLFFGTTALIHFLYAIWAGSQKNFVSEFLFSKNKSFLFPSPVWFPFIITWIALFLILNKKIKKIN